ncbi:ATP synthase A1, C subunit [Archaeoglobus sulfaticallidus PM70-1]|uniref:A-type ATP synthase subunit C n=1 Tax=Archaeoglobus sulfaticallidus PM70-1 TaxID=387631 RepID=N0BGL4_9EURY|nr:V-type ATP synthase subunit C [Archaeoglobus sulfaticallidus]AGK62148.1 ATP synthase A1, C subunit [Archaeoglobus sulfaticallidus PM70-1]
MPGIFKMLIGTKPSEWAYIVSRVRVMSRKLIPGDEYNKLVNMDLDEIIRYLEESEYKKEIDELGFKYHGLTLIDYAFSLNLSRTYNKLIRVSKGVPRDLISAYLRRYDIYNIINIIRGKMFNFPVEEVEATIIPAGEYDMEFFKSLMMKESIEEIAKVFEGTQFYPALEKLVRVCPMSEFEDDLYKIYYNTLAGIKAESLDMKYFIDFIKMEVDIKNIKTILRMKKEGGTADEIMTKIIPRGLQIHEAEARKLAALELDELMKSLEGYWFWEGMKDQVESELSKIEAALDRIWVKKVLSKSHSYPLSILPVMAFILLKKIEIDNLRIIARGKAVGLDNESIKEQLIIAR